nr:glyoxalase bleomycin resistance protein dioxygenase [Colletotrichum truncatum]KAF6788037.1 glyoxalase bleomycin resistance protein dioxygenase [Colletotrichum truncatum]
MYKYTNISKPFSIRPPQGGVNWIEIPALDVPTLQQFYKSVFPSWQFGNSERHDEQFISLFKIEEPAYIEGAIIKVNDHTLTSTNNGTAEAVGMTVYFLVDSIAETHDTIMGLGGKRILAKTDARGDGWYAKYLDPSGNAFSIYEVAFQT